jgi:hypothetical protein
MCGTGSRILGYHGGWRRQNITLDKGVFIDRIVLCLIQGFTSWEAMKTLCYDDF